MIIGIPQVIWLSDRVADGLPGSAAIIIDSANIICRRGRSDNKSQMGRIDWNFPYSRCAVCCYSPDNM